MTCPPSTPPSSLTAHQLFFELQALDPLYLHAHNGSALRGMLYRAVAELTTGSQRCFDPHVHLAFDPVIQRLLAMLDKDNPRGRDVPRPYVIEPPPHLPSQDEHTVAPGEAIAFGITLFGDAIQAFPVLVMAMKHAEARGLGRPFLPGARGEGRGRFRVVRAFAWNPLTRTSQEFLTPGDRTVMTPQVCIRDDDVMHQAARDAEARADRLRLHFHTPMTLKAQGEVLRSPQFNVLIHRLIERLTQLSTIYAGAPLRCLPTDFAARSALLRQADAITCIADRTHWIEVRGHSDRTHASTNLSGFVGTADFVAPSPEAFAPFYAILRWGELVHAGRNAVKGNGLFRIQVL